MTLTFDPKALEYLASLRNDLIIPEKFWVHVDSMKAISLVRVIHIIIATKDSVD